MTKKPKYTIIVEVDPGTEESIIKTSDGREWTVKGIAIFADGGPNQLFTFFWNSPLVAAQAAVRACLEAVKQGNEVAAQFYKCLLRSFMLATKTEEHPNVISPEELLARWAEEDDEEEINITTH